MSDQQKNNPTISGRTVVSKQGAAIRVVRLELSQGGQEALRSKSDGILTRAEQQAQAKKLQAA